jgi:hypothetical protein
MRAAFRTVRARRLWVRARAPPPPPQALARHPNCVEKLASPELIAKIFALLDERSSDPEVVAPLL